jgi:tetratricopeptide (TPR) repeat protein
VRRKPFGWARRWGPGKAGDRSGSLVERATAAEVLFQAGRYEQARQGFVAVVGEYEELHAQRPDDLELNVQLAGQLNNLGLCLGRLRLFAESVEVLDRSATIFDGLRDQDGPQWTPYLAGTLQSLAGALGELGRWPRALAVSRRAVDLRREAIPPGELHDLAVTLRMFAHVRAVAGDELDEAMEAINEAQALHMTVLTKDPQPAYVQQIYTTELVMAQILARQGETEAAERVAHGARTGHLDALPAILLAQRNQ